MTSMTGAVAVPFSGALLYENPSLISRSEYLTRYHVFPFSSVTVAGPFPETSYSVKARALTVLYTISVEDATGEKSGFRVRRRWMTRISEIRGSTGVSAGAGVDSSAVRLAVSSLGSGAIV
jgi:hypothetical protein